MVWSKHRQYRKHRVTRRQQEVLEAKRLRNRQMAYCSGKLQSPFDLLLRCTLSEYGPEKWIRDEEKWLRVMKRQSEDLPDTYTPDYGDTKRR